MVLMYNLLRSRPVDDRNFAVSHDLHDNLYPYVSTYSKKKKPKKNVE